MRALVIAMALVATAAPASADGGAPWAEGVSQANQDQAVALFEQGNQYMDDGLFPAAAELYEKALAIWNHPAIRGNLAICQINLVQLVTAHENLEKALAHGAEPFEPAAYRQLLQYRERLRVELVEIALVVKQPGTRVALNGNVILRGPGTVRQVLPPGIHKLTASRPGYVPREESLSLQKSMSYQAPIELMSIADATEVRRRWAPWKPWVVVGAGAVVALIGLPLELQARSDFETYARSIDSFCPDTGCAPGETPALFDDRRRRGERLSVAATSMFAVGGAALATGAVMLLLNRPVTHIMTEYPDPLPLQVQVEPTDGKVSLLGTRHF